VCHAGDVRADRLVATLLFLQSRGQVTAAEVADELEVSVKTARRDLEALAIAGIPVYSQPGRGGGWALVGGARTDLTGLTAAEARTLFLVAGPSSAVTPDAKAALRKLVRALPETFRAEAEKAASAVVLDPASWGGTAPRTPPHLEALQQAVVQGVQVRLGYTDARGASSERVVHPLGLVSKGTTWYLVADTDAGRPSGRLVEELDRPHAPDAEGAPPDFDLARAWEEIVATLDERRAMRHVTGRADPTVVRWMRLTFGTRLTVGEAADGGGWVDVDIAFPETHDDPARELCAYAEVLDVLGPPDVRARLAELGAALTRRYATTSLANS
jgi:predicted DNA-binding transcriptional regulator YafY